MATVGGGVATGLSALAVVCSVVAAPTVLGEAVCGGLEAGSLGVGALTAAADTYLAATGKQSLGPEVFDLIGLVGGVGGRAFEQLFGEDEYWVWAKTYGFFAGTAGYGLGLAETTVCGF